MNASITVGGSKGGTGLSLRVTWFTSGNVTVGQAHVACSSCKHSNNPPLPLIYTGTIFLTDRLVTAANVCAVPDVTVSSPQLWSPRSPTLYTAVLSLTDGSARTVYDSTSVTFGLKRFEKDGYHWKLNGEYLYLHGVSVHTRTRLLIMFRLHKQCCRCF